MDVVKGYRYILVHVVQHHQVASAEQCQVIELKLISFPVVVHQVRPAAVQVHVIDVDISRLIASVIYVEMRIRAIGRYLMDVDGARSTWFVQRYAAVCSVYTRVSVRLRAINSYTATSAASTRHLKQQRI